MKIIRKDATIEATGTDEDFPGTFRVILSSPTQDRDGDTLLPDEWKMPLPEHITFDVDHEMSVKGTIGSGVPSIDEESGNLIVEGTYSSLQNAQDARTLVNEKHIRTTSVAFMTVPNTEKGAAKGAKLRELLNGAFVAVPSNREALVLESKGLKAGARNAAADADRIQQIHDLTVELGASTETPDDSEDAGKSVKAVIARKVFGAKAIVGSLEAIQERIGDALQDAYPGAWVWVRGTIPDGDGGTVIYVVEDTTTYDQELYKQSYTDDGSTVTLTGSRVAVDVAEIVTPDADEDASSQSDGATKTPAAGAKAPAAGAVKAPTQDEYEALEIRKAQIRIHAAAAIASASNIPEGSTE